MSVAQNQALDDVVAPWKGSKCHKGFREEAPGFWASLRMLCSWLRAGGWDALLVCLKSAHPPTMCQELRLPSDQVPSFHQEFAFRPDPEPESRTHAPSTFEEKKALSFLSCQLHKTKHLMAIICLVVVKDKINFIQIGRFDVLKVYYTFGAHSFFDKQPFKSQHMSENCTWNPRQIHTHTDTFSYLEIHCLRTYAAANSLAIDANLLLRSQRFLVKLLVFEHHGWRKEQGYLRGRMSHVYYVFAYVHRHYKNQQLVFCLKVH